MLIALCEDYWHKRLFMLYNVADSGTEARVKQMLRVRGYHFCGRDGSLAVQGGVLWRECNVLNDSATVLYCKFKLYGRLFHTSRNQYLIVFYPISSYAIGERPSAPSKYECTMQYVPCLQNGESILNCIVLYLCLLLAIRLLHRKRVSYTPAINAVVVAKY